MSWRGATLFDTFSDPESILKYREGGEMNFISGFIFSALQWFRCWATTEHLYQGIRSCSRNLGGQDLSQELCD